MDGCARRKRGFVLRHAPAPRVRKRSVCRRCRLALRAVGAGRTPVCRTHAGWRERPPAAARRTGGVLLRCPRDRNRSACPVTALRLHVPAAPEAQRSAARGMARHASGSRERPPVGAQRDGQVRVALHAGDRRRSACRRRGPALRAAVFAGRRFAARGRPLHAHAVRVTGAPAAASTTDGCAVSPVRRESPHSHVVATHIRGSPLPIDARWASAHFPDAHTSHIAVSGLWERYTFAGPSQADSLNRHSQSREPAPNFCDRVSQQGQKRFQCRDQPVSLSFSQPTFATCRTQCLQAFRRTVSKLTTIPANPLR